jgi:hypothetical protein
MNSHILKTEGYVRTLTISVIFQGSLLNFPIVDLRKMPGTLFDKLPSCPTLKEVFYHPFLRRTNVDEREFEEV